MIVLIFPAIWYVKTHYERWGIIVDEDMRGIQIEQVIGFRVHMWQKVKFVEGN